MWMRKSPVEQSDSKTIGKSPVSRPKCFEIWKWTMTDGSTTVQLMPTVMMRIQRPGMMLLARLASGEMSQTWFSWSAKQRPTRVRRKRKRTTMRRRVVYWTTKTTIAWQPPI
jgi:hypothetical protein